MWQFEGRSDFFYFSTIPLKTSHNSGNKSSIPVEQFFESRKKTQYLLLEEI